MCQKRHACEKGNIKGAKENVDKVRSQVQRSVANVKERFELSRQTN